MPKIIFYTCEQCYETTCCWSNPTLYIKRISGIKCLPFHKMKRINRGTNGGMGEMLGDLED